MLCNSDHSDGSTYKSRWGEGRGCTSEERNITAGISTGVKTTKINRDTGQAESGYI